MASTLIGKNRLSLEQVLSIKSKTPFLESFGADPRRRRDSLVSTISLESVGGILPD